MPAEPSHAAYAERFRLARVLLGVATTALLVVVLLRVAALQASPPDRIAAVLEARERSRTIEAPRADVLDRRGRPVVVSRYAHRVFFDPVRVAGEIEGGRITQRELAAALAWMTGEDELAMRERVAWALHENRQRTRRRDDAHGEDDTPPLLRYVRVGGMLDDVRLAIVRAHPLPGVHVERHAQRDLGGGEQVASIVGKIGSAPRYSDGIERMMRARLEGRPGSVTYTHDAKGRPLWISPGQAREADRAPPLHLSLDLEVQRIVREELARAVRDADAAGGMAIAVRPQTGEVLAMADVLRDVDAAPYPWADARVPEPQRVGPPDPGVRYAFVRPDPNRAIDPAIARNRVVEDAYEPGSTFKPLVWATLADAHRDLLTTTIPAAPGGVTVINGRRLHDVRANGVQTWEEVLVNSSNIGMATGVQRISPQELRAALERFGIGSPPRVGLPDEAHGTLRDIGQWNAYTHLSVSFGQEVAASVAQMARAFCAFARTGPSAGAVPALRLTAVGLDGPDGLVARRAVSPEAARRARRAMADIAARLDGRMRDEGPFAYRMFGKSGTAQVVPERTEPWHRRPRGASAYLERQYVSSFVAGAPLDDPRLVVMVTIEDPGPELVDARRYYGSQVAGPPVRRIVERVLPYLGVPAADTAAPDGEADGSRGGDDRAGPWATSDRANTA